MEEKLFEYQNEENEDYLIECRRFAYFRMPSSVVRIAILCAIVILFIVRSVILTLLEAPSRIVSWIVTAALAVFYVIYFIYRYKRSVILTRRRIDELTGGVPNVENSYVTDTHIYVHESATNAEITLEISSLARVYETDTLIIVKTGSKLVIFFSKSGFTKGTPEDFVAFLKSKGVK